MYIIEGHVEMISFYDPSLYYSLYYRSIIRGGHAGNVSQLISKKNFGFTFFFFSISNYDMFYIEGAFLLLFTVQHTQCLRHVGESFAVTSTSSNQKKGSAIDSRRRIEEYHKADES